ncbi:GNAT family N-acetyltransferase [Granulicoccus phenolivorans]|uniref:GNAT family N-acetyltransferase n=1 Tax=Granulicoccus phenolivorans TaxID=266854 RepID=UPI00047932A2|nr:GNAT family N-acetyltransferase [Granulicoccus phenolivorans]
MTEPIRLRTARLQLRGWVPADLVGFTAMNADPAVMRYFPAPLSAAESAARFETLRTDLQQRGWGWWVLAPAGAADFLGFVGLAPVAFAAPFSGGAGAEIVEIGWRLVRPAWGHGYATEAARACVAYAFDELGLPGLVSFTSELNHPSRAVMQRLGMTHDPREDFDHPLLPAGDRLSRHVLYRLSRATEPAPPG